MANIDGAASRPSLAPTRYGRLLTALEKGVVVLDRDGSVVLIESGGAVVWTATAEQLDTVVRAMTSHPAIDSAAVKKLATLRQLTRANTIASLESLSKRERQILELICCGLSDLDMAELLHLSRNTVRNHVASLYRKLRVNRRSAAVIWAHRRGFPGSEAWSDGRQDNAARPIEWGAARARKY
jgi:DNA-binding CsgD family transcriptional regulator